MGRSLSDILKNEKPEIVANAKRKADKMLLDIKLSELREHVNKTQHEFAKALGVSQPTVASLEKPGKDIKLSTIKKYAEAAGGKLYLDIAFPNGQHYGFSV